MVNAVRQPDRHIQRFSVSVGVPDGVANPFDTPLLAAGFADVHHDVVRVAARGLNVIGVRYIRRRRLVICG